MATTTVEFDHTTATNLNTRSPVSPHHLHRREVPSLFTRSRTVRAACDAQPMIPDFEVVSGVDVAYDELRPPGDVSPAGSAGFNRDHFDLTQTSWPEAIEAVREERRWLDEADHASTTAEEFEEHVYDSREEDPDTGFVTLAGLDVGVAGLVLALSAAGYLPWISCSAHSGGAQIPQVGLYASAARTRILAELTLDAEALLRDQDGGLWVVARSVRHMNQLAQLLIDARSRLEVLPCERWGTRGRSAPHDQDGLSID
jgi:hypothetical protein